MTNDVKNDDDGKSQFEIDIRVFHCGVQCTAYSVQRTAQCTLRSTQGILSTLLLLLVPVLLPVVVGYYR
jgi:hypothetical protein